MDSGVVAHSQVAASIVGGNGGASGGLAGQSSGLIHHSYASGPVNCRRNCTTGGLVGFLGSDGKIRNSFSSAPVRGGSDGSAGGLVGTGYGSAWNSYSTGSVHTGTNEIVASSIGYFAGLLRQVFAVGPVLHGSGSTSGGLVAALADRPARAVSSYWDVDLTNKSTSRKGTGLTDAQLQAALPPGFLPPWDITEGYSYPFLDIPELPYVSTLATLVRIGNVFTFLPIEQLEPTEYQTPPNFPDQASLAAVYTMIARANGATENDSTIKTTPIDQYFWNDGTQTASWTGPVTSYATLGSLTALDAGTPIDDSNIIGPLKSQHLVILRGHYDLQGGGTAPHWMLATLFTTDSGNVTTDVVANDPWTGTQVWIDLTTHQVVRPVGFTLPNFTVDGYQTVTVN